ncbi:MULTISPECIES: DUF1217 domain-containing protein [unclassified Mesorhizobium]|uniref:DUF1217 domain-containing protein n=1 Tax=unclassified Mesorhizobium TaxID=325217 RepID=UPI001125BD3D|nr:MULTISPECIES: DUF1217 domain-containing protein [unclassified Mesorhizobium]TPI54548.1 DUF1217 domain-containing protein [Mesorhizobium sp. B3-1-1]TPJ69915.1 DUF1217 domain-containing protein [Mesorhizobium sp. B2-6-7]TPJ82059.1 DUF1217 domain-containing protein [Mesorhizobium sp. B2-6-3]TPJ98431.1 DUF1217 domain-containing protein [Mesorhizobium sp. B2-5-10]TPK08527.1 DUF1217 domain-containing protein [Mesorhizobium sp. B2-5-11]
MLSTYTSYQLITRDIDKSIDRIEKQPTVDRDTKYYLDNITKVKSIDDFVNNDRLFKYAMKAYGLEDMAYAKAFMVKALKEGVSDPDSFANKLTDKRYAEFVSAFNFAANGANTTVYNKAQQLVTGNYALQVQIGASQAGFSYYQSETAYYVTNISKVKSIDDLMGDSRLLTYAMAAFGLDAETEPAATVRAMLEGGVSDTNSPANKLTDKSYANFVSAFDFAQYGDQTTTRDNVQQAVPKGYMAGAGLTLVKPSAQYVKGEADYYAANISKVKSIDDLMADKRLLTFAMASYGLDASTETPRQIRAMLEGGVSDPNSPANKLTDKRYANFVTAFDFAQYGDQTTTRDAVLKDTPKIYTTGSALGLIKPNADYIKSETAYYLANITNVKSIDDLMANSRLYNYALSAYALDPATERKDLIRSVLAGGVRDPDSVANKMTNKAYAGLASAFNFEQYGEAATTTNPAQQPTVDKYMRQTLEEDAGQTNEGVRLALYFQRKAPDITSWYDVLADTALASVVRTVLGLPDSFATADVDKQAQLFEQKLDISDFSDPEKLGKFLTRFTSMYEINHPTSSAVSSISVLFAKPVTAGISTDLMMAMQKLKF